MSAERRFGMVFRACMKWVDRGIVYPGTYALVRMVKDSRMGKHPSSSSGKTSRWLSTNSISFQRADCRHNIANNNLMESKRSETRPNIGLALTTTTKGCFPDRASHFSEASRREAVLESRISADRGQALIFVHRRGVCRMMSRHRLQTRSKTVAKGEKDVHGRIDGLDGGAGGGSP